MREFDDISVGGMGSYYSHSEFSGSGINFFFFFLDLYSFDGISFAMNERMTKNRSAVSRTLPPSLVGRAHPCIASDLPCGTLSIAIVSTGE